MLPWRWDVSKHSYICCAESSTREKLQSRARTGEEKRWQADQHRQEETEKQNPP